MQQYWCLHVLVWLPMYSNSTLLTWYLYLYIQGIKTRHYIWYIIFREIINAIGDLGIRGVISKWMYRYIHSYATAKPTPVSVVSKRQLQRKDRMGFALTCERSKATTGVVEWLSGWVVDWSSIRRVLNNSNDPLRNLMPQLAIPLISIRPSYPKAERTDLVCQDAINLSFGLQFIKSTNHHRKPPTPHTPPPPQSHTIGGKIIIGGSYGIRHPSTSCRIELMLTISIICADQRCSDVYCTRTWLQPLWSRQAVQPSWQPVLLYKNLSTVEPDSLESTDRIPSLFIEPHNPIN